MPLPMVGSEGRGAITPSRPRASTPPGTGRATGYPAFSGVSSRLGTRDGQRLNDRRVGARSGQRLRQTPRALRACVWVCDGEGTRDIEEGRCTTATITTESGSSDYERSPRSLIVSLGRARATDCSATSVTAPCCWIPFRQVLARGADWGRITRRCSSKCQCGRSVRRASRSTADHAAGPCAVTRPCRRLARTAS